MRNTRNSSAHADKKGYDGSLGPSISVKLSAISISIIIVPFPFWPFDLRDFCACTTHGLLPVDTLAMDGTNEISRDSCT